jgi:hypothetical protein
MLCATLPLIACRGHDGTSNDSAELDAGEHSGDAHASDTESLGLPDLDAITCDPSFASIQKNVFQVACGFENCHGAVPAWNLYLLMPDTEDRLVNRPSLICTEWTLVVPGSPEQSLLWHKLVDPKPACGKRMPFRIGVLSDATLECIRSWILSLD